MDEANSYETPKLYRQTRFGNLLEESLAESALDENEAEAVRKIFDRVVFDNLLKRVDNKVIFTARKKIRQEIDDNTHSFILCGVRFDDGRNVIEVSKLRVAAYTDVNHRMSGIRASKAHDKKRMIVNCNPDMPSDLTELYKVMVNSVVHQARKPKPESDVTCSEHLKVRLARFKELWQSKLEDSEITAPIYWKQETDDSDSTLASPLNSAAASVASVDDVDDAAAVDNCWDEDEELNSDDDQSIDVEPMETDNIVVCCMKPLRQMKPSQDKPTKRQLKTKWKSKKFRFTEGVMHVNKRDYTFKVANVNILE